MSFNWHIRKVRDPNRSIAVRRSALGSCIVRLGGLTGKRYSILRDQYAPFLGNGPAQVVTEQQLMDAADALERERELALERLRAFEDGRRRAKEQGRRVPSSAEWRSLGPLIQSRAAGDVRVGTTDSP